MPTQNWWLQIVEPAVSGQHFAAGIWRTTMAWHRWTPPASHVLHSCSKLPTSQPSLLFRLQDCCVAASNVTAWRVLKQISGGQAKHRKYEAPTEGRAVELSSIVLLMPFSVIRPWCVPISDAALTRFSIRFRMLPAVSKWSWECPFWRQSIDPYELPSLPTASSWSATYMCDRWAERLAEIVSSIHEPIHHQSSYLWQWHCEASAYCSFVHIQFCSKSTFLATSGFVDGRTILQVYWRLGVLYISL